jgi:hypothetical protein
MIKYLIIQPCFICSLFMLGKFLKLIKIHRNMWGVLMDFALKCNFKISELVGFVI